MRHAASELSALISRARRGDEPSDEDRRRVTSRVTERLALGAGVGALAFAASRLGWASSLKTWGVVAVTVAGLGSGAYLGDAASDGPRPSVVPSALLAPRLNGGLPITFVPELSATAPDNQGPALESPAPRRERAGKLVGSPQPSSSVAEPGRLARETAALRAANEALRGGAAARALGLLDAFAKEFPSGVLTQEALATRVSALCALGRVNEARAVGTRFVQRYPRSPVGARVRGSCAMPKE